VGFDAPGVGPAVLVRTATNEVCAFSRVCTHAGCLVGYDASSQILVCPCHGAEYDPARHAVPIAGPTSTPLQPVKVVLDKASGQVILPS
jgi:thiosulfate dehydrogenase [quinone] large subunit